MKTKIKDSIKVPTKRTKNCNWIADNNSTTKKIADY